MSVYIRWLRSLVSEPSTVTISKDAARHYFVSFLVEEDNPQATETDSSVSVDLGITDFVILSNGQKFGNQQFFRKEEKWLALVQRALSKKQKGSKNQKKVKVNVTRHPRAGRGFIREDIASHATGCLTCRTHSGCAKRGVDNEVGNISATETRVNEFDIGYILLLTICIFTGVLLIVVVPDSVRSANLFSAERNALLVSESYMYGNRGVRPPRSSRGNVLGAFFTIDDAFRYATNELRKAAKPPSDKSGSRTVLRRR